MLAHTVQALHLFQATPSAAQSEPDDWQQEAYYGITASRAEDTGVPSGSQSVRSLSTSPCTEAR